MSAYSEEKIKAVELEVTEMLVDELELGDRDRQLIELAMAAVTARLRQSDIELLTVVMDQYGGDFGIGDIYAQLYSF
ncbi:hypothetical protein [Kitasatospora sp. MBT66]|uniref:hypothetical protein n=1 Tax=Kitasatospora sp. MBT66 TaxID=1444769 RepID=UPI0005BD2683|nr:hypothetical protein [Kitasatospora sp. MBT66]